MLAKTPRHILGLSGGKDSAALAVFMRDRVEDMEYVFTDTGKELAETYDYLDRLETFLGKPIVRLNADRDFDHWRQMYGGMLPSPQARWCTRMLKLKPFEDYVGDDPVISYVAIRADEDRRGYISTKPNIRAVFPFVEERITKPDIRRILDEAGLGLPDYYQWRSRSGCFFCFFQRKSEWVGLLQHHPKLFEEAMRMEKVNPETGESYTWSERETLEELSRPERQVEILMEEARRKEELRQRRAAQNIKGQNVSLWQLYSEDDDDDENIGCMICHK